MPRITRKRSLNHLVYHTISEGMYDLLDKHKKEVLTAHEKLNEIDITYSQQILRLIGEKLLEQEDKGEVDT